MLFPGGVDGKEVGAQSRAHEVETEHPSPLCWSVRVNVSDSQELPYRIKFIK